MGCKDVGIQKSELVTNTQFLFIVSIICKICRSEVPIEISSTFCGAHSVPKGKSAAEVWTFISSQIQIFPHIFVTYNI